MVGLSMNESFKAEQGGIFHIEDIQAEQLAERFQELLQHEPDADRLMEDAALAVDDFKQGRDPDFSWVPDHLRVQVMSEWTEARQRLDAFKESQAESQRELASGLREEVLSQELQETAERSAKLSELEEKFGAIPEEGKVSQRQIKTEIIKPQPKSRLQKFFDSLAGKP